MRIFFVFIFSLFGFLACFADDLSDKSFFGHYQGEAKISDTEKRNLEVDIKEIDNGFNVSWKTITQDAQGSGKSKSYSIDFIASDRAGIYGSAMKTNLFGGQQALDPIKGEPYFWAKVNNNVLTIFGMLINESGDYEIQQYERIFQDNDLVLNYSLIRQEGVVKTIHATLSRTN